MNDQPIPPVPGGQPPLQQPGSGVTGAGATERVQLIIEAAEQAAAGIISDAEAQARAYLEESRQHAERLAEQRAREMWGLTDDLIERAEAVRRQSDELLRALDAARRSMDEALRVGPVGEVTQEPTPLHQQPPAVQQAPPPPPEAPPPPPPVPVPPQQAPPSPAQVHHLHEPAPPPWQPQEAVPPPTAPVASPQQPQVPPQQAAWSDAPVVAPPQQAPPPPLQPQAPPLRDAGQPSEGARLLATQMAVAGSSRAEIEGRLQHEFGIREAKPILDAILGPER